MPPLSTHARLPGSGPTSSPLQQHGGGHRRASVGAGLTKPSTHSPGAPSSRGAALVAAAKKNADAKGVTYGESWYQKTRGQVISGKGAAAEIARRKAANWEANGRKRDREDLYTASRGGAWEGSEYVGSSNNVLTWIIVAAVGAPVAGLVFAYLTYGKLWG